jgi:hypothetical protein
MLSLLKAIKLISATRKPDISTCEEISSEDLVEELTDIAIEKISAGAVYPPEIGTEIPVGIGNGGFGLSPDYSPLPKPKLPRLGALDPAKRTSPKNAVTITIPIPTIETNRF